MDSSEDIHSQLLDFIVDAKIAPLMREDLFDRFAGAFIDTLSCSVAGLRDPSTNAIYDYSRGLSNSCEAPALVFEQSFSPESSALVNAVIAHAIDYDDVAPSWRGHPSAVIIPSLLAVSGSGQATGEMLAEAYAISFEIGSMLGRSISATHYPAGWHATSTIGVIAATAGCCRILKSGKRETESALAHAVAQSAGTRQSFGTMGKPLNAGLASSAAVRAIKLALSGMTGTLSALDGSFGFINLYGKSDSNPLSIPKNAAVKPLLLESGTALKTMPSCYATHRGTQAALKIRSNIVINVSDVKSVTVISTPGSHDALLKELPGSPTEAKFSLEYCIASVIIDGKLDLDSFSDAAFCRSEVHQLMEKVVLKISGDITSSRSSRVMIQFMDDQIFEHTCSTLEQEDTLLRDKLTDCLRYSGIACDPDLLIAAVYGARDTLFLDMLTSSEFKSLRMQGREALKP